ARQRRQVTRRRGVELSFARLVTKGEIPGAPGRRREREACETRLRLQRDESCAAELLDQPRKVGGIVDDARIGELHRPWARGRRGWSAGFNRLDHAHRGQIAE